MLVSSKHYRHTIRYTIAIPYSPYSARRSTPCLKFILKRQLFQLRPRYLSLVKKYLIAILRPKNFVSSSLYSRLYSYSSLPLLCIRLFISV